MLHFKKNKKLSKKIASKGYSKAHKIFNNKLISKFIVDKSMNNNSKIKSPWFNNA